MRDELGLTYGGVGLLLALPAIFGNIVEPPLGLLGDGWNRRALVRAGGVAFLLALLLIPLAGGMALLLVALMLASPASGAFCALSQAVLMDRAPARREQNLARWAFAGSLGVVAGPLVLAGAVALGLGWRAPFLLFAVLTAALLIAVWRLPMPTPAPQATPLRALTTSAAGAWRALRQGTAARWLALLQMSDLMLDVLYSFLGLYFVDVTGVTGAGAALAILVWTGTGLLGDALVIPLLERVDGIRYLRTSALLTIPAFAAFLLVDATFLKLVFLATLGLLNSGWYAILQARLYSALPQQSATVMALGSVFGIAGALLPLAVGLVAQQLGLAVAMWLLLAAPVALLLGLPRQR